jgi:hypothetical protein
MFPQQLEMMHKTGQAVEHGQLPQPLFLKWNLSALVRIFATVTVWNFQNAMIQQIQSFFIISGTNKN